MSVVGGNVSYHTSVYANERDCASVCGWKCLNTCERLCVLFKKTEKYTLYCVSKSADVWECECVCKCEWERERKREMSCVALLWFIRLIIMWSIRWDPPMGKKETWQTNIKQREKKLDRKRLLGWFQLDVAVHNFSFLLNISHRNY